MLLALLPSYRRLISRVISLGPLPSASSAFGSGSQLPAPSSQRLPAGSGFGRFLSCSKYPPVIAMAECAFYGEVRASLIPGLCRTLAPLTAGIY